MKKIILNLLISMACASLCAQQPLPPDKIYGQLFSDVQVKRIFPDGKTFVDCTPKRDPAAIAAEYKATLKNPGANLSLEKFVADNFDLPESARSNYVTSEKDAAAHVKGLWSVLQRVPDKAVTGDSLLPLPYPYIVPGGRFREIYYWDSYFTMLGLKESGETEMIENMVRNFAYLIETYGHIPNGNRTYYLSRSQPPFFSLMVELLAGIKGDGVYETYLPALEKEYRFWMEGADKLKRGEAHRRAVKFKDGTVMNRYWDDSEAPRQESYREDVETADRAVKNMAAEAKFKNKPQQKKAEKQLRKTIYRNLRAGAESGMDFSSRWFADKKNIETIETTALIAVDLNCLLYHLEQILNLAYTKNAAAQPGLAAKNNAKAADYGRKSLDRRKAIEAFCWNEKIGMYADYQWVKRVQTDNITMAGMYPLFFQVADRARASRQKNMAITSLLKAGGFLTTTETTRQQWDSPNGWPPLQWIGVAGLELYGFHDEAKDAALRWIKLNTDVFSATGKMMEKYNVSDTSLEAGGGEYPSQDGFGWTNGVLLKLMAMYKN
jgi:alpha,alpha-trehalase